jgi:HAE1 family hydrophobic/amphiphilic exporter-1
MEWLIRFSLRNQATLVIITVLISIFGVFSAQNAKQELLPDINFPVVTVITPYPLASPDIVESQVSKPIENALSGLQNLETYSSNSSENVSVVILNFQFGTDLKQAEAEINSIINRLRPSLPSGVQSPTVSAIRFGDSAVLQLAVSKEGSSAAELKKLANREIIPSLEQVAGVSRIDLTGAADAQIRITLDPAKLEKFRLDLGQVAQAVQSAPLAFPVGRLTDQGLNVPLKVESAARTVADLAGVVVGAVADEEDLARVQAQARAAAAAQSSALVGISQTAQAALRTAGQALGQAAAADAKATAALQALQAQAAARGAGGTPPTGANPAQGSTGAPAGSQAAPTTAQPSLAGSGTSAPGGSAGFTPPTSSGGFPGATAQSSSAGGVKLRPVLLSEVAKIELTTRETTSYTRFNGNPALGLAIFKVQNGDTLAVTESVQEKLEPLREELGLEIDVLEDQGEPIKKGVEGLLKEGGLGGLFAVLVVLLFLGDLRSTLVTAISIPVSLLVGLIFLQLQGLSLNVLTLGGLTIAIGRLIDDAIVVVENTFHKLDEGLDPLKAALEGAREVVAPVTASTITTVAVFLPLAFVGGISGEFLGPLALAVTFSILASLLVAFTVIPLFGSLFLRRHNKTPRPSLIERLYRPTITWVTRRPGLTLLLAFITLMASSTLVVGLPTNFIGGGDPISVVVSTSLPPGTPLDKADALARSLEEKVRNIPQAGNFQTVVGRADNAFALAFGSGGGTSVRLVVLPKEEVTVSELQTALEELRKSTSQSLSIQSTAGGGGGFTNTLQVRITATDSKTLQAATDLVFQRLKDQPDLKNVRSNLTADKTELSLRIDNQKAYELGVIPFQAVQAMQNAIAGRSAGNLVIDEQNVDMLVAFAPGRYDTVAELKTLKVKPTSGDPVALNEFAQITPLTVPNLITRENGERFASVLADPGSSNLSQANAAISKGLEGLELPAGAQWSLAGVSQQQSEAFGGLILAFVAAIGLVYVVMVTTFRSLLTPFLLLFSIPLVGVGAFPLMKLTDTAIGLSTMFGFLLLIGIVVTNAIVLIDLVERLRERGSGLLESLIEGGARRVRPIVMTALTTILALAPLAAGFTEGSGIVGKPLAITVIGGLTSSTLLTLVVIPALYLLVERFKERRGMGRRKSEEPAI